MVMNMFLQLYSGTTIANRCSAISLR